MQLYSGSGGLENSAWKPQRKSGDRLEAVVARCSSSPGGSGTGGGEASPARWSKCGCVCNDTASTAKSATASASERLDCGESGLADSEQGVADGSRESRADVLVSLVQQQCDGEGLHGRGCEPNGDRGSETGPTGSIFVGPPPQECVANVEEGFRHRTAVQLHNRRATL